MATNRADTLDPALLRPGRLDRKIEFPMPDRRQKRLIFSTITAKMNLSEDVDLEDYIARPDRISGADINAICQEVLARLHCRLSASVLEAQKWITSVWFGFYSCCKNIVECVTVILGCKSHTSHIFAVVQPVLTSKLIYLDDACFVRPFHVSSPLKSCDCLPWFTDGCLGR